MHAFTRPAIAPALRPVFVLLAVLALGAVDAARAQTVTLALSQSAIEEDGGTATVTATLAPPVDGVVTVEVSAEAFALRKPARGNRFTMSATTTLTFAAMATTSTGTVTITAVDNEGHTRQDDSGMGIAVRVWGAVSGVAGVENPEPVTLSVTEDDGIGDGTDTTRPTVVSGTVDGDQAVLTFSEALLATTVVRTQFQYRIDGQSTANRPASVEVPGGATVAIIAPG